MKSNEREAGIKGMRGKIKLWMWLSGINLFISAFTFGGGYVVVPMIRKYFVFQKKLFSEEELMNMAAIAQSSPGAIAVNLSVLAGYRAAGVPGIVISGISAVIPPLVILSVISAWYAAFAANTLIAAVLKGMQAGVAALIVDFVADMTAMVLKENSLLLTVMMPASFAACFIFKINVALILVVCCCLCAAQVRFRKER
ncbi:chromate transporter [Ruminococcus gauvreauii]